MRKGELARTMFRRCVSLLLIVGMFASQLAAVPHAHGATSQEEQRKHDATPHFHWFGYCQHCHSHSHSHAHGKHGHHHHETASEHDNSDRQTPRPDGNSLDHDADAIYLGGGTNCTMGSSTRVSSTQVLLIALQTPVATSICGIEAKEVRGLPWRPPDQVLDDSETYLTLRTLRI
jgi:hypothetical protein